MKTKVEMHTIVCDNCDLDIGATQEYSCWNDDSYAEENAIDHGWLKEDDKHYCHECHSYDYNGNLVLKDV